MLHCAANAECIQKQNQFEKVASGQTDRQTLACVAPIAFVMDLKHPYIQAAHNELNAKRHSPSKNAFIQEWLLNIEFGFDFNEL